MNTDTSLTQRQQRELDYHSEHAESNKNLLNESFRFDVVEEGPRRWWNQYWAMYTYLLSKDLQGKDILVIGCGFGEDALNLAKAGARVKAFDISPESLEIAKLRAEKEGLEIEFEVMVAEKLNYTDNTFDIVVARDILHHVEIPLVLSEILRVSKPSGTFCFNEVYSHSAVTKLRYSKFVDQWLYPKMLSFIYKGKKPYITDDEERLTEIDVNELLKQFGEVETKTYFNAFITRVIPERFLLLSKLDYLLLKLLNPIAFFLGSRVLVGLKFNNIN